MKTPTHRILAVTLLASLVAGCEALQAPGAGQGARRPDQDPCNVVGSAAIGVVAGAILGDVLDGKKGARRGAGAGGILASVGCVAINANSRQTKSAYQAEYDYQRSRGRMPADPQVVSYISQLASPVARRGQPLRIHSIVELVNGSQVPIREVREELVVYDTHGEPFKSGSKPLIYNNSGRFENSFELTLPREASPGVYGLKTNLYINGKLSASRDLTTRLVWQGSNAPVLAALALPGAIDTPR